MKTTSNNPDVGRRRGEGAAACPAPTKEIGLPPSRGWRSVKDDLPDDGLSVLICQAGDQDSVEVGAYASDVDGWYEVYGDQLEYPTHWMELPEVPLEEVAP